jgi:hypothetical protein
MATPRRSARLRLAVLGVVCGLLAGAPAASADPVVAAAGDIACGTGSLGICAQQATSDALATVNPDAVILLGDDQYEYGTLADFTSYFGPTWGRWKAITHPAPGNHEYETVGAAGYFDYFNGVGNATGAAGARGKGYYSWDLGAWHVIALNSNCYDAGGCGVGDPQEQWLRADLAAHPTSCTLAYWHHPRWSSDSVVGSDPDVGPLVQALYDYRADLVLAGHAHTYERFAPQNPSGQLDTSRGLTEIISGTGGKSEFAFSGVLMPNSMAHADTLGVLRLALHPTSYDWQFVPAAGDTFTDSGTALCHGRPVPDTTAPAAPTGLTATPGDGTVALAWQANTESDLAGYRVYRSTTTGGPYSALTSSPVTSTQFTDRTATNWTAYHYVVKAVDTSGNLSAVSGEASATPAPIAPLASTASASAISQTSATLNGRVNPNGQPTSWYFDYGRTPSYGSRTATQSAGSGTSTLAISASIGGLSKQTNYHYRLVATWSSGAVTKGADVAFTTTKH